MKRHGLLAALAVTGALAGALACSAEPRSADPKDPGDPTSQPNQMHGVTLTPTAPRQDVALAPAAAATTLVLTMATIDNPSSQAFSLSATLIWTGNGTTAEETIGTVSPFPATQPGSFVLTVPDAARKWLARGDGQLALRLALQPVAADRPLADPLRVTIGEPAWH